jgi:hypothetical protein
VSFNFNQIPKPTKNSFKTYDGIYYDSKQIIFSKGSSIQFKAVNIYTDPENKAIKLEHGDNFTKNRSHRISVSGLNIPKGRYERVKDIDSNGAIYQLAPPTNKKEKL